MRAQSRAKIMANACKIMIFEAMIAGWYGVRVTVLCIGSTGTTQVLLVASTAVHVVATGTTAAGSSSRYSCRILHMAQGYNRRY